MNRLQTDGIVGSSRRPVAGAAALWLALVVGPTACERAPADPFAPEPSFNSTHEGTHFISTPPDPAYVGQTYLAAAQRNEFDAPHLWSETPSVCAFAENEVILSDTVTFVTAGTCILAAQCKYCAIQEPGPVYQEFPIVNVWTADVNEGLNVVIEPVDSETQEPGPVQLIFDHVTSGGTAAVSMEAVTADSDVQPPANFQLGDPAMYYHITLSDDLTFEGAVRVCITYTDEQVAGMRESELQLLHWNGTEWEVLENQLVDTLTNTVCATTTSFSPFLIGHTILDDKNGRAKQKSKSKGQD
jgi:hypothetical protein